MRFGFWNARLLISLFAFAAFGGSVSAQDFRDRSDAEFALLGPRMESGLRWDVERRRDDDICKLTEADVRQRVRKKSAAVQKAAFDVWSEAKLRCEGRRLGIEASDRYGFNVSVGVGGQFSLDASTETNSIFSNGAKDPQSGDNKSKLNSSGVVGQFGIGYDWSVRNLFSPLRTPGVRPDGFVGVNLDVTFGGGSAKVQGIPGIVPFIAPGVATMDTLRFRNDVTVSLTGRIGSRLTPMTGAYLLGGVAATSVSFKYDCPSTGFCGVPVATNAFVSEQNKWTGGGVIGAGVETQVAGWLNARGTTQAIDAAAMSLYFEYRAYIMQPVDISAGTQDTRYTSQRVDPSFQTVIAGAKIKF